MKATRRCRTAGPIKSLDELEARRRFRDEILSAVTHAALKHLGKKRRVKKWLHMPNALLDGRKPFAAISDDYLKEHVLHALSCMSPQLSEESAAQGER